MASEMAEERVSPPSRPAFAPGGSGVRAAIRSPGEREVRLSRFEPRR